MFETFAIVGGIVLADLALSGDNALVIGATASTLPRGQRLAAVMLGGAGAIVLRIVLAAVSTILLQFAYIQAIGGLVLVVIAIRLLWASYSTARSTHQPAGAARERSMVGALLTILLADLTMSLDNILAIGALAAGHVPLLVIGLIFSIAILLVGSAVVAALIARLRWLLDVAAAVLAWTAANMVLADRRIGPILGQLPSAHVVVLVVALVVVAAADILARRQGHALVRRPGGVTASSRPD